MKLYWPKTRAFRALWMLEELGVVYELVPIDLRSHEQNATLSCRSTRWPSCPRSTTAARRSPNRARCCSILPTAAPAPETGVAPDDPLRGRFLQWMFFTPTCLEPAMAEKFTGASGNPVAFGWGNITRVQRARASTRPSSMARRRPLHRGRPAARQHAEDRLRRASAAARRRARRLRRARRGSRRIPPRGRDRTARSSAPAACVTCKRVVRGGYQPPATPTWPGPTSRRRH